MSEVRRCCVSRKRNLHQTLVISGDVFEIKYRQAKGHFICNGKFSSIQARFKNISKHKGGLRLLRESMTGGASRMFSDGGGQGETLAHRSVCSAYVCKSSSARTDARLLTSQSLFLGAQSLLVHIYQPIFIKKIVLINRQVLIINHAAAFLYTEQALQTIKHKFIERINSSVATMPGIKYSV